MGEAKIPNGWRALKRHEIVKFGDRRRGPMTGEYVLCQASVGFAAGLKDIIRRIKPEAGTLPDSTPTPNGGPNE